MSTSAPLANPCEQALEQWCKRRLFEAYGALNAVERFRVAVAYSAGADSTALLLAAHRRWPGQVVALHVHHGLQAAADGFESHARDVCAYHGIALQVSRVQAAHKLGESPEAAARDKRYATLASMAQHEGVSFVLLGQHADDQAETLLLALSRGAGLPGLACMSERFERHGVVFGRPLLGVAAATLRAWLQSAGHSFVDDPTNTDVRYTRNRIRAVLTPAWEACFPGFRTQLARSARHAAEAQTLLDDLARLDLVRTGEPPAVAALQVLSRERQTNAIRHWLRHCHGVVASAAQLNELLDQVADCRTRGHRIHLKVASGLVVRSGDRLSYTPPI